jgi:hypothetical protein
MHIQGLRACKRGRRLKAAAEGIRAAGLRGQIAGRANLPQPLRPPMQ